MPRLLPLAALAWVACEPAPFDPDHPWDGDFCSASPELDPVRVLPRDPGWTSDEEGYATGLGWADVDGDGLADLVVASGNDMVPGPVSVHRGQAEGSPSPTPDGTSSEVAYHGHLAVGDVDGDGYDDVVVARYLGPGRFGDPGGVDLYLGGPAGLATEPVWSAEGFHTFSVALGDADGDGDLDLAVAVGEPYYGEPEPDRLYLGAAGRFEEEPAWTGDPSHSLDVAFVDPDDDGDLDLVFARWDAPHARFTNGGGFGPLPDWEAPGTGFSGNTLDFGDVDGDGRPDLLVTDTEQGRATLYCGVDWAPCWERDPDGAALSASLLVDVDGDGSLDAVLGSWWGNVEVWPGEDGGLGATRSWRSATTSVIEAFAARDLDGAHEVPGCATGNGLVAVPRGARVVATDPPDAAVGDGYVSVADGGAVEVRWLLSRQPDLAVSNWNPDVGSWLFAR